MDAQLARSWKDWFEDAISGGARKTHPFTHTATEWEPNATICDEEGWVIIDLLGFTRTGAESIGKALARLETLRGHVQAQAAGFDLPTPVLSWLLLEKMHIARRTWPLC